MHFLVIAPRTRAWILAAFLFFVSSILRAALWRKTAVARSLTNRFRSMTPCHQYCWIEHHQRLKFIERMSTHYSYTVLRKQVDSVVDAVSAFKQRWELKFKVWWRHHLRTESHRGYRIPFTQETGNSDWKVEEFIHFSFGKLAKYA